MKKLDVDLLAFMSESGPHDYITEEDAIEDLSDGKAVDKKSLLKYFTEIRIDHNKGRDKGTYDWVVIKAKLQSHIKQKALFPNAKFCNTISDASLHEMDLVISQNSTASFLAKMDIYCKKAVVILLGNFGEDAPVLPTSRPTAVFDVLVEKPVLITSEFTTLPQTAIKASLYLPGPPNESEFSKMKFLSKKAMEKGCSLGSVMSLEESHCLASFADQYENAAICNVSLKIADYLLSSLSYFSNLVFTGDKSLQDLVAKSTTPETAAAKSTPPETAASANSVGYQEANI